MKTLKYVIKIIVVLFIGTLFFSCSMEGPNGYGNLVINLPESAARALATVPSEYASKLYYRVDCTGNGSVSQFFRYGDRVSISLPTGGWNVTVTVLNAGGGPIGSGSTPVTIESGKTTNAQVPVTIAANSRDITFFAITSTDPNQNARPKSLGYFVYNDDALQNIGFLYIFVLPGTSFTSYPVLFDITHTGLSIDLNYYLANVPWEPGTQVDFGTLTGITVKALDGSTKEYDVEIMPMNVPHEAEGFIYHNNWNSISWSKYDLPGFPWIPGNSVAFAMEYIYEDIIEGLECELSIIMVMLYCADPNTSYNYMQNYFTSRSQWENNLPLSTSGPPREDAFMIPFDWDSIDDFLDDLLDNNFDYLLNCYINGIPIWFTITQNEVELEMDTLFTTIMATKMRISIDIIELF